MDSEGLDLGKPGTAAGPGHFQARVKRRTASNQTHTTALEREIDRLVYALYGLTAEEIKLVEARLKKAGSLEKG